MGHTHAGMAALTWGLNVNYILLTPDLNVVQVLTIVIVVMVGLAFASFFFGNSVPQQKEKLKK